MHLCFTVLCTIIWAFCCARLEQFCLLFCFTSSLALYVYVGRSSCKKRPCRNIYRITYLYHIWVKVGRAEGPSRAPDKRVRTRARCKLTLAVEFNVKAVLYRHRTGHHQIGSGPCIIFLVTDQSTHEFCSSAARCPAVYAVCIVIQYNREIV